MKHLGNEGGFTLVEAMISSVILTVGLLGAIQLMTISINGQLSGKKVTVANSLAKQIIEDMKNVSYKTTITNTMPNRPSNVSFKYKKPWRPNASKQSFPGEVLVYQNVSTSDNRYYTIVVDATENKPKFSLAEVNVKVFWDNATHSVEYLTYFNM
jgi:type II secretory pathway pseudopilin PulG